MVDFIKAETEKDFKQVAVLADSIWREHYIPIVGKPQIDYMLEKYQSVIAISKQVADDFQYYVIHYNTLAVGYLAIKHQVDTLFLSKIYVSKAYRGKKIGREAMLFIEDQSLKVNCKSISLTVNKNNVNAIEAYKKLGFTNQGPVVKDIGNGFVMDDYKMEKTF